MARSDDIWQHRSNNKLIVVDYKATAKNGEVTLDVVTQDDEWKNGYKRQMEIYIWLLRKQNFDVDDRGFFLYANGQENGGFDQKIEFDVSLLPHVASCDWIEPILLCLKACLIQPLPPSARDNCEFCGYVAANLGIK